MAVGSLVVKLGLDAVDYINGFNKAEQQAAKFAETSKKTSASIDRQVKALQDQAAILGKSAREAKLFELAQKGASDAQLKSADAALKLTEAYDLGAKIGTIFVRTIIAAGVAAGAAVVAFEKLVGGAANFQDLAEKTGTSAEMLASFKVSADVAATSMDSVAAASVKLTKGLAGADEETEGAANAIKNLGFNVKEFQALDPGRQIEEIAKKLAQFEDGAGKTAAAVALFGKAGAELLPFLKELAQEGGRQVILTQAQIEAADRYKDAQARLISTVQQYAQVVAIQVIPVVTDFGIALLETAKQVFGLDSASNQLGGNSGVEEFARTAARVLAFVIDAADGVSRAFQIVGTVIAGVAALPVGNFEGVKRGLADIGKQIDLIIEKQQFSQRLEAQFRARDNANNAFESNFPQSSKPALRPADFGGGSKKKDNSADLAKRELDNFLKEAERAVAAENELLSTRNKFLDLFNRQGLVSIQDYYNARRAIVDEAARNQVAQFDREIKALQDFQKKSTTKPEQKIEAEGKINDLLDKRAQVTREATAATIELGIQQTIATDAFARQLDAVNVEILELTGNLKKAAEIRFDNQFDNFRKQLEASGNADAIKKLDDLRRFKVAQAEFDQEQEKSSRITQQLGIEEERLSISRQAGAITELGFLKSLGDRRKEQLSQLRAVVEAQEAIARASPDNQKLVQNAERARLELEKLAAVADPLADKFNSIFEESFGDAFGDFITGAKTAKEAFTDFANSVANQISRMAAQDIASSVFGKGGVTGGGFGSILAQIFGSSGGSVPIFANGTDYVPQTGLALVHQGEKIITAADNRTGNFGNRSTTINVNFAGEVSRASGQQLGADLARRLALSDARVN